MPSRENERAETARKKSSEKEVPRAVAGIQKFRARLAKHNPRYQEAVELEQAAEEFCRALRKELRDRRKKRNLDQKQLAEYIGLTQSAISRLEKGSGDIGAKTVFRYAHALGLRPVCVFIPSAEYMIETTCEDIEIFNHADILEAAANVEVEQTKLIQGFSEKVASFSAKLACLPNRVRSN